MRRLPTECCQCRLEAQGGHRDTPHLDIGELLTLAMPLLPRVNQGLICHILGAILGAIF